MDSDSDDDQYDQIKQTYGGFQMNKVNSNQISVTPKVSEALTNKKSLEVKTEHTS